MLQKQTMFELQEWMKSQLMFPKQSHSKDIASTLHNSTKQTAQQKLNVYQRSYYLRLLKCMREQYPALCYALGEDLFNDFSFSYLQTYPSESYTLYDLGTRFPIYLKENRPDSNKSIAKQESWIDFMLDLAEYELKLYLMFDAPGNEGQPYATLSTADKHLKLQPCFQLGHYEFNVAAYYHLVRENQKPNFPRREPVYFCMVRNNFRTQTIALEPIHYFMLKIIQSKECVSTALNTAIHQFNLDPITAIQSWKDPKGIRNKWIEAGFFCSKIK